MDKPTNFELVKLLKEKNIPTTLNTKISIYLAQQIALEYAELKVVQCAMNNKVIFKKGFAVGYKKGYCHRSDRKYEEALFNAWRKFVAIGIEKRRTYGSTMSCEGIEGELEIVNPKKIIK